MEPKMIGLIALVVLAVGLLAFSFRSSFGNGPRKATATDGARMAEIMKAKAAQAPKPGMVRPGTRLNSGMVAPGSTGAPR